MPGVEVKIAVWRRANVRKIRRRRRAQPRPRSARLIVASAGKQFGSALDEGVTARGINRSIVAVQFRGPSDSQSLAEPGKNDSVAIVAQANVRRCIGYGNRNGY